MLLIRSATNKDRVAVPTLEMLKQESAEVVRRRRPQQLPAVLLAGCLAGCLLAVPGTRPPGYQVGATG